MTIDEYLVQVTGKTRETIKEVMAKDTEAISTFADDFQNNVIDNIPVDFGTFLYDAIGDRVTGQRSSVLNMDYINGSRGDRFRDLAKANNCTIEEAAAEIRRREQNTYYQEDHHIYLTAGRKFGVSYHTGDGSRVHTHYFHKSKCFKYLMPEHAQCVKQKDKRKMVEDFVTLRDEFIDVTTPYQDCLVPTFINADLAVMSKISVSSRCGSRSYNNRTHYTTLDNVIKDRITHIRFRMPTYTKWCKTVNVKPTVKSLGNGIRSFISATFLNITDNRLRILGNVDIAPDEILSSSDMLGGSDTITTALDTLSEVGGYSNISYSYARNKVFIENGFTDLDIDEPTGLLFNIAEIVQNPCFLTEMNKRIDIFKTFSTRLQGMKHEHADLYFVNSAF